MTVFDLETTCQSPAFKNFGIIEVGLISIDGTGSAWVASGLVSPGHSLPSAVTRLTGIAKRDVMGMPLWDHVWRDVFHHIAEAHVTVGYNSVAFDCRGVVSQNERYGRLKTAFRDHIDVMRLSQTRRRSLEAMVTDLGLQVPTPRHRALPDAIATARLLDHLTQSYDETAMTALGREPAPRSRERGEPRDNPEAPAAIRAAAIAEAVSEVPRPPSLEELASAHHEAVSTIENDVWYLVRRGRLPVAAFADPSTQAALDAFLPQAVTETWTTPQTKGKLKPPMEWLLARLPGNPGLNYFQLRLGLYRLGLPYPEY